MNEMSHTVCFHGIVCNTYVIDVVRFVLRETHVHPEYIAGEIFTFFRCGSDTEVDDVDGRLIIANVLQALLQKQTVQPLQLS